MSEARVAWRIRSLRSTRVPSQRKILRRTARYDCCHESESVPSGPILHQIFDRHHFGTGPRNLRYARFSPRDTSFFCRPPQLTNKVCRMIKHAQCLQTQFSRGGMYTSAGNASCLWLSFAFKKGYAHVYFNAGDKGVNGGSKVHIRQTTSRQKAGTCNETRQTQRCRVHYRHERGA